MPDPVIILGSGLAGYAVARELRKLDPQIPIIMVSADHGGFYSKPMLSNALTTGKTADSILSGDADKMASQLNIKIQAHVRVTAIDKSERTIMLASGERLSYSQLVLALGADQICLPLDGSGVDEILTVNDLDDYRHFREVLEGKKQISIIGAGLIGCEFANDLAGAGFEVNVLDISNQPLGRLLPPEAGQFIQEKLEAVGVTFHFNTTAKSVDKVDGRMCVTLDSGQVLAADIVLSSVGLRSRTQLAKDAGLTVNRGVVVNQLLQTSAENIFAIGDCAEVEGKVLPFVMPITHAGRALAATLSGNPTPVHYPAMPVMVKTSACQTVVSPPDSDISGTWQVETSQEGVKALFQDADGNLLGYALLGAAVKEKMALTPQLPPVLK